MRVKSGSVTVTFALVFVLLFSFIISFFEMASHIARASYHASAALLATENYFAAYFKPLYEEYHIFAREVPAGEDFVLWTEENIGADVAYMTRKQEGERSLLLRSGAAFEVTAAGTLTDDGAAGFYRQAATAMKYRGVLEVTELLTEFTGMTEQAEKQLEVAAAKAAVDSAYGKVDERILHLIGLVDGVDIVKYEKFLGGKGILFQKDAYVKYFCTDPGSAAAYFDRTEVYQSFLSHFENPCETLEAMASEAELLASEIEEREAAELECRNHLAELLGKLSLVTTALEKKNGELDTIQSEKTALLFEIGKQMLPGGKKEEIPALEAREKELDGIAEGLKTEIKTLKSEEKTLKKEQKVWEKEKGELEKRKKSHEKSAKSLVSREEAFVNQAGKIRDICEEAYDYVEEIQAELKIAKTAKTVCETVLDAAQSIIGEESAAEYREGLEEYGFYENAEGYDFDRMKQTLLENKSVLWNIKRQITGTDARSLQRAVQELRSEKETVKNYSFEGLKLNYGEISLAGDLYDGVESMLSSEAASGFLGFLTDKELSEKLLDTSYLPSGFSYETEGADVFSLLGSGMSSMFTDMGKLLPDTEAAGISVGSVVDPFLFQAYLSSHFSDFFEENETGALSYEQEYLVAGKASDQENLSAVAMRLCAIRAILHFVALYTDSERKAPVEQAALAACGAIGLPALKSIVVFLLLFVWALEEAMIDTAALFQGKSLLLYPGKSGGSLMFHEILLFSKSFVLEKAKNKKDAHGVALGYKEYLQLFLFLTPKNTKSYRALDLIQENIRGMHRKSFRINRCVCEITYSVDGKEYAYAYK